MLAYTRDGMRSVRYVLTDEEALALHLLVVVRAQQEHQSTPASELLIQASTDHKVAKDLEVSLGELVRPRRIAEACLIASDDDVMTAIWRVLDGDYKSV